VFHPGPAPRMSLMAGLLVQVVIDALTEENKKLMEKLDSASIPPPRSILTSRSPVAHENRYRADMGQTAGNLQLPVNYGRGILQVSNALPSFTVPLIVKMFDRVCLALGEYMFLLPLTECSADGTLNNILALQWLIFR